MVENKLIGWGVRGNGNYDVCHSDEYLDTRGPFFMENKVFDTREQAQDYAEELMWAKILEYRQEVRRLKLKIFSEY